MRPAKILRDNLPTHVAEVAVAGCEHSYYALSDGSYLILASPNKRSLMLARGNVDRLDDEDLIAIIEDQADEAREHLSLRDEVLMMQLPPKETRDKLSLGEAWELCDAQFYREDPGDVEEEEPEVSDEEDDDSEDDAE